MKRLSYASDLSEEDVISQINEDLSRVDEWFIHKNYISILLRLNLMLQEILEVLIYLKVAE